MTSGDPTPPLACQPVAWRTLDAYVDGEPALFWFERGERGNGGAETARLFRDPDGWSFWTHGGPNAGDDWEPRDGERPTHFILISDLVAGAPLPGLRK